MDEKEKKILKFWKENKIFEKSLEKDSPNGEFVFYDGPVTANAAPVFHTMEPFAFKDLIPRYKTMRGFHVPRKGGWDTHGLPVELQIEKKLGFKSKKDIENYGIAAFNKLCRESVWEFVGLWKNFAERMGYWADQEHAYVTYHNDYIEALWGIVKKINERGLLYKDYKVVPWCPRCGTALSSHELAQGYQDDKDLAVTVKFKVKNPEKIGLSGDVFLLAWTTTPWTLPGNVALAVGEDIEYSKLRANCDMPEFFIKKGDIIILAKNRQSILNDILQKNKEYSFTPVGERTLGSSLIGLIYEPLYPFIKDNFPYYNIEKAFKVYAADFVNTEEGTGIVHTAVMYGQDDFLLGTKIGLPKFHIVNDDGHFKQGMDFLSGRFVKDVPVAVDIIKDLAKRNLLFKKENHTHSYPHCWRCKTPLIYYARDSWYIAMSKLRDDLVKENEDIHWEPEYIKEGRFGEWLREVKDWAISRERYWGTPLPVWENENREIKVIGSIDELKKLSKTSGNTYYVMRHGETEANDKNVWSTDSNFCDPLTKTGDEQVKKIAVVLKGKIDMIISSPYMRTRETAALVAKEIGLSPDDIVADKRLGEWNVGAEFNGKQISDFFEARNRSKDKYAFKTGDGESYNDVLKRAGEFLYDIEKKYSGKRILIVSHGSPCRAMFFVAEGYTSEDLAEHSLQFKNFQNAEARKLPFAPLPHNENYELDLHKPYIDELELPGFVRAKEVMDVWFDSGGMPFASGASGYPADYIAEAIDQTRGWFYTLHAVGVLMEKGKAFKNVISLGHILDASGKKMSKSLGNVLDPMAEISKYGADALRLWMYTVNGAGESKNFSELSVDEIIKKVWNPLSNILSFYELYANENIKTDNKSKHVLDIWIISRLNELVSLGTKHLDNYKIFESARPIRDFVNDFSTWYIRRSRDRFKNGDKSALQTTKFVLLELAKYMAPFTPFFAEEIYQKLRNQNDPESVHLCDWPEVGEIDTKNLENMEKTRDIVSKALEIRQNSGIKVRQPLPSLAITEKLPNEFLEIIAAEVNVEKVEIKDIGEISLNAKLTEELIEKGKIRDAIRAVQEWRKGENLKPGQIAKYQVPEEYKEIFEKHGEIIKKSTNVEF